MKDYVWVVMANDFPEAVFADEAEAKKFIDRQKADGPSVPRIYWRSYGFKVRT